MPCCWGSALRARPRARVCVRVRLCVYLRARRASSRTAARGRPRQIDQYDACVGSLFDQYLAIIVCVRRQGLESLSRRVDDLDGRLRLQALPAAYLTSIRPLFFDMAWLWFDFFGIDGRARLQAARSTDSMVCAPPDTHTHTHTSTHTYLCADDAGGRVAAEARRDV